jgi:hypothetical protein
MTMRVCDLDIERIMVGNLTLREVLDRRTDVLTTLITTGKQLLHRSNPFPFLFVHLVTGSSAFAKINNAIATVLQFSHDLCTRDNVVADLQYRSIEVLLNTLAFCHPTEEDRKIFADLSLRGFVIEMGKRVPAIRKAAKKVLKKFGTGEWLNFVC